MTSVAIRIRGLRRTFGDVVAVDDVDIDVMDGEFLTLLGPSGSGKTTVLRMIAGFERPDAGTIELAGVDVTEMPPYARDVNTVFQDYALFPHMTVIQNVEYGLMVKKVPKAERQQRALAAWSRFVWPATSDGGRLSSQVVNARGLLSRAPWSTVPKCYSSTNPWVPWTSSCGSRCRWSSRRSSVRWASPSSS